MYKFGTPRKTTIKVMDYVIGETIETKVERILNNNEPITDGAPLIYTERKDGIKPEYDIRTDRMELAVEAFDKSTKAEIAKRQEALQAKQQADAPKIQDKPEP